MDGSMRLLLPLAVVFICVTIFWGCYEVINPKLSGSVKYYTFSEGREVGKELNIRTDSALFKSIEVWLSKKRPWRVDINSYAPVKVIESELAQVTVVGNVVVLSIRKNEKDNWDQFSCRLDDETTKLFQEIHNEWEKNNVNKSK